ncbi:inositol-hexakisphosphate/diphosphoinositol-pentakisphosphate 1-kinase [Nematocida sp. LUAm3]|nr:inositol-hexakisphosphate/diphosphoinositol-pentakisphosphate 1-kinase [Nematocida sp. LUAm3]KAI5175726.1 inositol-hexakisphosphate/diphosphoinositol-pentakisphosphate 1-kinase [Nematocida sp. LUAm2]KAI5178632.1 inositol-hexakisphosphate/diphosphoinositol-pentakisphosphate 1-kinase [Nematocida sp. LUAm1]
MQRLLIQQIHIGVFITDSKGKTAPMKELKAYLQRKGYLLYVFDDKYREGTSVENWPYVDVIISFFSNGIDFLKIQKYVENKHPLEINNIKKQFLLLDRRCILSILDKENISTAPRILYNIEDQSIPSIYAPTGCLQPFNAIGKYIYEELKEIGICPYLLFKKTEERCTEGTRLRIGNASINRPYVEKPIYSENHNINIYYGEGCSERSNGVCRLFRKIGHRSSEFIPYTMQEESNRFFREERSSYIYEEYLRTSNYLDIKAYTVGKKVYAETRKSPAKDGIVIRNSLGKEERGRIQLTEKEIETVRRVSKALGQFICGMDLLRTEENKFFVVDVNGWSFVKSNPRYYKQSNLKHLDTHIKKQILKKRAQEGDVTRRSDIKMIKDILSPFPIKNMQVLSVHTIYRHGSRTPKMKKKLLFRSNLLRKHIEGMPLSAGRDTHRISEVQKLLQEEKEFSKENENSLKVLNEVLRSTKEVRVKFYPLEDNQVKIVLKWGGSLTASSLSEIQYEAMEYEGFLSSLVGDSPYVGYKCPEKEKSGVLTDKKVKIISNPEDRTQKTAEGFKSVLSWTNRATEAIEDHYLDIPSISSSSYDEVPEEVKEAYSSLRSIFLSHCSGLLQVEQETLSPLVEIEKEETEEYPSVFSFLSTWCFLFNEYKEMKKETVKTAVPLVLDLLNYEKLEVSRYPSSHIATQFIKEASNFYSIFYEYTKEILKKRLNTLFSNNSFSDNLSVFLRKTFTKEDTLYVTKRFTIICLLKYLINCAKKEKSYINNSFLKEIEENIHNIGFLSSLSIVHILNNTKKYFILWYSPGISSRSSSTSSTSHSHQLKSQRKRPLLYMPFDDY